MRQTLRHQAYPVEKLGGLLFAYMGPPEKKPLLPRWDILVWQHGTRKLQIRQTLNCNWLQAEENTADFVHTYFLHGQMTLRQGKSDQVGFFTRPFARYGFQPCPWGIIKSWNYEGERAGEGWGNLVLFPTMLRQTDVMSTMHWRVPIDDTHTTIFQVAFQPSPDGSRVEQEDEPPVDHEESWLDDEGDYHLRTFASQDGMAWETQGALSDRTKEHLGHSDQGVAMLRQMLLEQIAAVERGEDPMAIVRDPEENELINLEGWASERELRTGAYTVNPHAVPRKPRDEVFDDRYELVEVPFGTARPKQ
jgi:5,5'-dehydrodivanillate O-demethylase